MSDGPRIVTIFRSRTAAGAYDAGYEERAAAMQAKARTLPGFIEFKSYVAEDGEKVSVTVFASRSEHEAWANDLDHRAAQSEGRASFYDEYRITVAEVTSERAWPRA